MKKKTFDSPQWDLTSIEVKENKEDYLSLVFYWPIYPKKNWKRAFRWMVLPSENYMEWNKRCLDSIKWIEFKYNRYPCAIHINCIAHNQVKSDIDNQVSSILDFFQDAWIIPDDNRFIVSEISVKLVWMCKNAPCYRVDIEPLTYELDCNNDNIWYDIDKVKYIAQHMLF